MAAPQPLSTSVGVVAECATPSTNSYRRQAMKKLVIFLAALVSFGSPALAQAVDPPTVDQQAHEASQVASEVREEPPTPLAQPATSVTSPAQAKPPVVQQVGRYFEWRRVGASPLTRFRGSQDLARSQVLTALGYNPNEVRIVLDRFRSEDCVRGTITAGDTFRAGSFVDNRGRIRVTGKVRLTDTSQPTFDVCRVYLRAGDQVNGYTVTRNITVTLVYRCANVVEEEAPPPPPPVYIPPPTPPTIIPPPPNIPPPPEAKKFCDSWRRFNAVVGAELELGKGWSRSAYGAWGIYCMQQLKDGEIGFGPAGQHAEYGGDPGRGHFKGGLHQIGLGMMRVWNKGVDLEAKAMIGHYRSTYTEGDYEAHEKRWGIGASVAINDYRGMIDGSGRPKRQYYAGIFKPFGGSGSHSWQGQDIGKFSRLSLYYNAGVRQYLLKHDPKRKWNPYVQVGLLGEIRSGKDYFSCSIRVGVSNRRETIGIHAGINTCNGGVVPAIGAWYDLGTDLRLKRAERRAKALSDDTGEGRMATRTFTGRRLLATRE